jgi:two-component system, NtrC family, nitrogen regulation sensor histidine kinase GlnL
MKYAGVSKSLSLSEHEQLLSAMPLPMLLVDENNHIVFANDASESFLGRSRKNLLGSDISDALKCSDERFNLALSAMEGNLSAQDMELDMAGGLAVADLFVSVLTGDAQRRLVVISPRHGGRAHISEHNEAGDQLAMGAPAILGHEIKNPLAGIKGAAQLLARQIDEKQKSLTDLIVNEVDRIARLLDQMQNLGDLTPANIEPVNIHLLIERAIRSIRAANKAMPEISISYDPSLPDVMIDADAMVQILINLMQNAIDALDQKMDAMIMITTRFVMSGALRDAGSKNRSIKLPVEISISDNGPGVPKRIEDELFAPFVTTKRDGQGLGLAIVRKLITQMNSRILYERDASENMTHFRLFLPVQGRAN